MTETAHTKAAACIMSAQTRQRIHLRTWHTIGRSPTCTMQIDKPSISKQHALIAWDGDQWRIRDLHSRNGTWLDSRRLQPGQDIPLTAGAMLAFGTPSERWTVSRLGTPTAVAISLSGHQERIAQHHHLPLPSEDDPEAVLFQVADRWSLERADGTTAVIRDGEQISVGDTLWRIHLPKAIASTCDGNTQPTPATITLRFSARPRLLVSYLHGGELIDLPQRAHHRLLLVLAQARLRDQQHADLPEAEHGWMYRDQLDSQLSTRNNRLYVYAYRARAQLADCGVLDAAGIIERRADTHQIRIGVPRLEILS